MPTFCRHGRVLENCSICSKASRTRPGTVSDREAARRGSAADRPPREPRPARPKSVAAKRRAQRPGSRMVVRHIARAVDDGYDNPLVPGLRASDDARRLAEELAYATARLQVLRDDPPGIYGEAVLLDDREESLWLCFLTALLSPLPDGDPFRSIAAARVPWSTGELPDFSDAELGPRSADARKLETAVGAYRAHASRAGSQAATLAGDPSWTPQRRFDRAFERLSLSGFGRGPRYEFLVIVGHLGLADVEPWTLALADAMDPVTIAAKRVFGIGDPVLLGRRAHELVTACGVQIAALDLALFNWSRPPGLADRYLAGVDVDVDEDVRAASASALRVD